MNGIDPHPVKGLAESMIAGRDRCLWICSIYFLFGKICGFRLRKHNYFALQVNM